MATGDRRIAAAIIVGCSRCDRRELTVPSDSYRYYCLDGTGELHGAAWFHARDDDDAIALIKAKHPDSQCEIWQHRRLVACLMPELRSV